MMGAIFYQPSGQASLIFFDESEYEWCVIEIIANNPQRVGKVGVSDIR